MNDNGPFSPEDDELFQRCDLIAERIRQIQTEEEVDMPYRAYFSDRAGYLTKLFNLYDMFMERDFSEIDAKEWIKINDELYEELLPEAYETSYANPAAIGKLLEGKGNAKELTGYFSWLSQEVRGAIPFVFEKKLLYLTTVAELFVEVYCAFIGEEPGMEELKQIAYWYAWDNCELFVGERTLATFDPRMDFAAKIIEASSGEDLTYLYHYGEYISDDEIRLADFLWKLPKEKRSAIARVYTEGYRTGFVKANKPLDKKKAVNIRYHVGMEAIVKEAIEQFREMGLSPVIYRQATNAHNRKGTLKIGYEGADPNPQYIFDHRQDEAVFYDKKYVERRLEVIRNTFEENKEMAAQMAGPAVIETFGEIPFSPQPKAEANVLSEKQQEMSVYAGAKAGELTNTYIPGEERSFTIIAFPLPSIGDRFEEIFEETMAVNTLDAGHYEAIQAKIIDALDKGVAVHITGMRGNQTDLTIMLQKIHDPEKETGFENCVADVNIPVGEVFTSPELNGTSGVLHVIGVYLDGLKYRNLSLTFRDGEIIDYACDNFDDSEKGRAYIRENILYNHTTLPIGEFAIGTNTTAYAMARRFDIEERLPILIAEKTGPHFAVGDTCYSHEEDVPVYNPNGKEIIARENKYSRMRDEDMEKAYFQCHTDITIPYDELGEIVVICENGETIPIIEQGRFVLPGTEELNIPLDELEAWR